MKNKGVLKAAEWFMARFDVILVFTINGGVVKAAECLTARGDIISVY